MKLHLDIERIKGMKMKEGSRNWINECPFKNPQHFACTQMIPCGVTTPMFPRFFEEAYPPESAIKPEFIQRIKEIHERNEGKLYDSMDDFINSLKE